MICFTTNPTYTDKQILRYLFDVLPNTEFHKSILDFTLGKVQVERSVNRQGTSFIEKYWVNPNEIEKTDIIIGGYQNLPKTHELHPSKRTYKEFQSAGASMLYFGNNEKITLKSYGKWAKTLTEDVKNLLNKYTHGLDGIMNGYLRGLNNPSPIQKKILQKFIRVMQHQIDNFELKDDIIVHRKVSIDMLQDFKNSQNNIWQDDGFCSTSTVKGSYSGKIKGEVLDITIKVPKGKGRGAWMAPLSHFPHENEFLLNRGTLFKINKIEGNHVEMEVIGREPVPIEELTKSINSINYDKFVWQRGEIHKKVSK